MGAAYAHLNRYEDVALDYSEEKYQSFSAVLSLNISRLHKQGKNFVKAVGEYNNCLNLDPNFIEVTTPSPQQQRADQLKTQLDAARRAAKAARLNQQEVKLNQQRQKLNQTQQ